MSLAESIAPYIPHLRRFARLLTGTQSAGDAAVERVLQPLFDADPELRIVHEHAESAPPLAPEPNLPLAKQCVATLRAAGIESEVTGAPYTTNANHYGVAGLPTVILGPGDIAQAHTAEEWIEEAQLELGVRGYRAIIEAWNS